MGCSRSNACVACIQTAILISKSNNLYRQKKRFNRWQNRDRQSVLDGCNFSYSVIMRVMTFLVGVLKSASSIKMRIAGGHCPPYYSYFRFFRLETNPNPNKATTELSADMAGCVPSCESYRCSDRFGGTHPAH